MTIRVQADPMPQLRAWLQAQMPDTPVRSSLPKGWTPDTAPVLIVEDDGGPAQYPIRTTHTIRITAWADGKTIARQLAAEAAGRIVAGRVPGIVHTSKRAGAVLDARDKDTGAVLASALITSQARMRDL